ncbi:hypothetical protein M422DRAFT_264997 [Sphaerobolus stellatus SS14]|uniref:Uncharacterized protein n=1 Tax=Sphaerobolus stellatus (strain SS14) TaxID=990650 RepID=A0A0C9V704_SPHS4|nr:hypothetical protein M422DRAFT_264997 [Sphaerobolus stellatus SS14]
MRPAEQRHLSFLPPQKVFPFNRHGLADVEFSCSFEFPIYQLVSYFSFVTSLFTMSNTTAHGQPGLRIPGAGTPAPTQVTGEAHTGTVEGHGQIQDASGTTGTGDIDDFRAVI